MDKNALLIRLSEEGRFWRVEFERLTLAERVFRAIWELEGEVNNGGFEQYFFNTSGDTAFAVVDALREVGAHQAARIAEQANALFPGSACPKDRAERQKQLGALGPGQKSLLEDLDGQFYAYPDNLTELLFGYVRRHANEIEAAAALGF
ncbi:MAG: DMP19 family protein [Planctomycetes bacterium]|nr:DMP19 family protein [Planctomycetota bacterium]